MKIRSAHTSDLNQILDLLSLVIRHMDENRLEQWPNWYPNREIIIQDITKNQLFVAEVEGKIRGMLCLSPDIPLEYESIQWIEKNGKINSVHRLAVDPQYKVLKLAKLLMSFAEEKAKSEGYTLIRLDTYSLNLAANRFYTKIGYHYCGQINLEFMPEKYNCYEKAI